MSAFDFDAYRTAVTGRDADRWASFYADDATWTEYRQADPPRAPHVMRGPQIPAFIRAVARQPLDLSFANEVIGDERAAYTLIVGLGGGKRIIENVIITHRDGRIVEQTEVEAWD